MHSYRNTALLMLLASMLCGCANLWHDMKPHRIRRLNRIPAPSWDPEFSSKSRSLSTQFVSRNPAGKPAVLTANSAEVTLARGQNDD